MRTPPILSSIAVMFMSAVASTPLLAGVPLVTPFDIEPNGTTATANFLPFSPGNICRGEGTLTSGDVDFYRLNAGFIDLDDSFMVMTTPIEGLPGSFSAPDTIIDVYDENGNLVATDDDSGTDFPVGLVRGSVVRFVANQTSDYFVRVRGFNASAVGRYQITAAKVNLVGSEIYPHWVSDLNFTPPNSDILPLTMYPMMYGFASVDGPGDPNYAAFDMSAGDLLNVSAVGVDGLDTDWNSPNIGISILDGDGTTILVTSANDSAGQSPGGSNSGVGGTIRFRAPATGRYYLRIDVTTSFGFCGVVTSYIPAAASCPGDADGNGTVNFADITNVLANFNIACP